jgi:hypothetical protein
LIRSFKVLAYEEGDHVGVPGLLWLEVLHGHLPVVPSEMPQENALHLVCELKHLLKFFLMSPFVNPFFRKRDVFIIFR